MKENIVQSDDINEISGGQVTNNIGAYHHVYSNNTLVRVVFDDGVNLSLIRPNRRYLVLRNSEPTFQSLSVYEATHEMIKQFSEYLHAKNMRNMVVQNWP